MKATKITDGDIADKKISALPTRPTAKKEFGGGGYTASELKEAFDALPLYIIERFNEQIDDINSGKFSDYLCVFEMTLTEVLAKLREDVDLLLGGEK